MLRQSNLTMNIQMLQDVVKYTTTEAVKPLLNSARVVIVFLAKNVRLR